MEHGCTNSLRNQSADAVFFPAHHCKSDHLGTAAGDSRSARQSGQTQTCTNSRRRDRKGQCNTDQYRNQNPHPERLLSCCPADYFAKCAGRRTNRRCNQHRQPTSHQNGDTGRHKNINFGFLGYHFAQLSRDDCNDQHRQRSACSAQCICRISDRSQRKQHQWRTFQRISNCNRHCTTAYTVSKTANCL